MGETWVVVGEETLGRLAVDGVQAHIITSASTVAVAPRLLGIAVILRDEANKLMVALSD